MMLSRTLIHYGFFVIVILTLLRGPLQVVGYLIVIVISCGTIVFLFRTNRVKFIWFIACIALSGMDIYTSFFDAGRKFNPEIFISHEANTFLLAISNERYIILFVVTFFSLKVIISMFFLLFLFERRKGGANKRILEILNDQEVSIGDIKNYYRLNERIGIIYFLRDVGSSWKQGIFPDTGLDEIDASVVKSVNFIQGVIGILCFILIPVNNLIVVYELPILIYSIISGLMCCLIALVFSIRFFILNYIKRRGKYHGSIIQKSS